MARGLSSRLCCMEKLRSCTPEGKKGVQRHMESPSDWGPIVRLRRESHQEGEIQGLNGAEAPTARRDKRQSSTQEGRRQTTGQAERRAGRHAGRQASKQRQGRERRACKQATRQVGGLAGHFASQMLLRARLEWPFRASCGSRPGSRGHFEPGAAPSQARPAISSHLWLRARLETALLTNSGISRNKAGHEALKPPKREPPEARRKL